MSTATIRCTLSSLYIIAQLWISGRTVGLERTNQQLPSSEVCPDRMWDLEETTADTSLGPD